MERREFLKKTAAAAAGITLVGCEPTKSGKKDCSEIKYTEGGEADIIVAGGGPAGIGAAITAAKCGKKVLLLEAAGCLGGIWTSGTMTCVIDFGRGDVAKELIRRLDAMDARVPRRAKMLDHNFLVEPEYMKIILDDMCAEAGVRYILKCPVVAVEKDRSGRKVTAVFTESKSGRQRWAAKAFIDATGDGDLAAVAGCGFDFGGEKPGDNDQPASLHSLVTIEDDSRIAQFIMNDPSAFGPDGASTSNRKIAFKEEAARCGSDAAAPTLVRLKKNLLVMCSGFEYGVRVDDAEAVTRATVHARKEIFNLTEALKKNGGEKWKGLRVVSSSDRIWNRAARRIHGVYTITNEDIIAGAQFPDAVATSNSEIDVHSQKKGDAYLLDPGIKTKPFQIPFRACQARDVDNVYMAGRCISGNFYAMASYRMSGPAVEMGENVARRVCEG